jgi:hypothetical protein
VCRIGEMREELSACFRDWGVSVARERWAGKSRGR